jgi:hypothetical protein
MSAKRCGKRASQRLVAEQTLTGNLQCSASVPSWRLSVQFWTNRVATPSSSRSLELGPSVRLPASRSAFVTKIQIDCDVGSNSRASSSGVRPDRTSSTICRRNSGGYAARYRCTGHLKTYSKSVHQTGATSTRGQEICSVRYLSSTISPCCRPSLSRLPGIEAIQRHADFLCQQCCRITSPQHASGLGFQISTMRKLKNGHFSSPRSRLLVAGPNG